MNISRAGLEFIKTREGFRSKAYLDSAGVPTIGYGTICLPSGDAVQIGMTCTNAEATEWLENHIRTQVETCIQRNVAVDLTQNEYDSICSFIYNLGCRNFKSSTLLKKINLGDSVGAGAEFIKWNKAGGRVIAGLTTRRQDEAEIFNS